MFAAPSSSPSFSFCSYHYPHLLQIYPSPSSLALIGFGRCPSQSAVTVRAKFEKFDADNAQPPTPVATTDEVAAELRQELDEDSDLPSDLEGAIRQSGQASAAFITSGGMRAMVELLIPQLQFLDAEGAQGELWELSRIFLETLIEETGIQKVRAIFPDAGAAALLKYQWGDANFGFASLSDRRPVEKDDEVVVMLVPDYQMLEYVERIASQLSDDPVCESIEITGEDVKTPLVEMHLENFGSSKVLYMLAVHYIQSDSGCCPPPKMQAIAVYNIQMILVAILLCWVAAPPYRSSPGLDGRLSIGSSFGSVSYDSPLGPTPSHLSQPLASPDLDPASVILVEKCIRKKSSHEPETECIHFVDANDITDNEDFFEDETEVIKLDPLYDLNPDLGVLVPLDLDTLIDDIPLDKVCMDDINLIPKEANLTLNTLKLNSEDSDLIVSPTKETSNNSNLILNNSDEDNLELEVSQLDLLPELDPDLIDPKSIELRVMTKHDPIENTNMSLEDRNLKLKDFEHNWNNEHSLVLLESILGVAPLDLHLIECVFPDLAYPTIPCTDFNVRDSISPYIHVASLTIVPAFVLETPPPSFESHTCW
ncbi:hypothetical protein M5K25_026089 [Dendrobium thyrsiflorum]|uniref:DUF1995 domain-containing protein n=1 Tax=Dendrobium thyrsiflorum TaxID=117978 RepID=A0ABD0TWF1_DENTH